MVLAVVLSGTGAAHAKTKRDYFTTARAVLEDAEIEEENDSNDNGRFFRRKQAAAAAAASIIKDTNQRHPDGSYNYE